MKPVRAILVIVLLALSAKAVAADPSSLASPGYSPAVPVSSLARPNLLFEPSRLHLTTTVSVGSGFGSSGTSALQVTRLSYQFRAPVAFAVSVGNAWGPTMPGGPNQMSSMFLEGLDFSYQPTSSMMFQVHYQNLRSPLQYQNAGWGGGFWAR